MTDRVDVPVSRLTALVVGFTARKGLRPLCPDHRAQPIAATPETPTQETTTMHIEILETPSPAASCPAKGCDAPPAAPRKNSRATTRGFCAEHTTTIRSRGRTMGDDVVARHLREGTLPPVLSRAEIGRLRGRAPAWKPTEKKVTDARPAMAPRIGDGLALVRRLAAVVARLGGIDAAEALADELAAIGGGA